jgi:hypothetical protein
MLKAVAAAGCSIALPTLVSGQRAAAAPAWRSAVLAYLESLSRGDGGYAWEDQAASHLTPTFAVIGCYRLLGQAPPNQGKLAEFVRTHHPARLKKLEQEHHEFEFQQIQSLLWLGEDASSFRRQVSGWTKPYVYLKQYERHGYPIFRFEVAAFTCRELLGLPLADISPEFVEYLDAHRRANGSFNNTPAADGGDGHVISTWWGLRALGTLGRGEEQKQETIAWLRACQLPCGGFTYQPNPEVAGVDDVAYTWAAVRALEQLGSAPAHPNACVRYLHLLWNADGGCGDRPGWASNPMASYDALDALRALHGLDGLQPHPAPRAAAAKSPLPGNLDVFSIQIEAHGRGSPAEAVDLAGALRIHLWGAKNAKPQWLARAQAIADRQNVPVKFFHANEEYGTWVDVPGLGTYSHTSDVIAPAGADFGPPLWDQGVVSWPEFRRRRLAPLQKAGGCLVWQFGENEELVRMYLDDSLQRGGYAAISTFHFGNPDFTNSEPFLYRWRGRIPYVALQDAHGNEPWWFVDMTTGFRTLFLGTEPSWEAWLRALKENWVVAVRHDAVSGFQTWMHAGRREVVDFVCRRELKWRWWDNPAIQRPLVSIVAVRPEDECEAARPKKGVMIRVRCAWENTTQGLPKKPIAELVRLTVDGVPVAPQRVAPQQLRGGAYADHYHQFQLSDPAPGRHTAAAIVRVIETQVESRRQVEFFA